MAKEYPEITPPKGQDMGYLPPQTAKFTVKEHQVTNQPGSNSKWNPKMGNPLGPK